MRHGDEVYYHRKVSIGGRTITNLQFADNIDAVAQVETKTTSHG